MFQIIFLVVLALVWILFATVQDLRKREISNWLNFSLVVFALGFRFFYSLFFDVDFWFFYQGLIGFGIFFALGEIFYYGKMFAGGDVRLLRAMGAILPFSKSFMINVQFFILFFLLFLFVGAIYGLIFSLVLILRHRKEFGREFAKRFTKKKRFYYLVFFAGLVLMGFGFLESLFFYFGVFVFILPYLFVSAKSVDEVCMVKKIKTKNLTEGDWLYKDLRVGKKLIKATWDGLEMEDIKLLRKGKKEILIREGIAYAPVFLMSFALFVILFFIDALDFFRLFMGF